MSAPFRAWLHGLGAAFIGGCITIGLLIFGNLDLSNLSLDALDKQAVEFSSHWRGLLYAFVGSGLAAAFFYLRKSPLPDGPTSPQVVHLSPDPSNNPTSTGTPK
jgi:hypothetical protein